MSRYVTKFALCRQVNLPNAQTLRFVLLPHGGSKAHLLDVGQTAILLPGRCLSFLVGGVAAALSPRLLQPWRTTSAREVATFAGLALGMTAAGLTRVGAQLTENMDKLAHGHYMPWRTHKGAISPSCRYAKYSNSVLTHLKWVISTRNDARPSKQCE